jgi:hypothetical protein
MATEAVKVVVYVHAKTVRALRRLDKEPKDWVRGVVYDAVDELIRSTESKEGK